MYLLLVNPKAGNKLYRRIERRFIGSLNRHKIKHKIVMIDDLANTADLLKDNVKDNIKAVAAMGGNGTVTAVIDALADYDLPLAIIPTTKTNHLARLLGVANWQAGVRSLAHHHTHTKRLGKIGQRYFMGELTIAPKRNLIKNIFGQKSRLKRFFGVNRPITHKNQHSVACQLKLDSELEVNGQLARLDIRLVDEGKKKMRIQLHTLTETGTEASVLWANKLEVTSSLNMPIVSGNETLANTPATIQAVTKTIEVIQPTPRVKKKRG
ncbi:MAG: diacylglycerol kinase family protein [Patescibacteria group bacterium]|jgi:diacylglycerol kinase family enzyme